MSVFDRAFGYLVNPEVEGDLSLDPADPGNWTGGAVGKGELRGTKYGISASAYPTLNIGALTLDDARAIFYADYWVKARCDQLPDELAFCLLDAVVNHGVVGAIKILQRALGVEEDGVMGPATIRAAQDAHEQDAVVEFQSERVEAYTSMGTWHLYGRGWTRRAMRTAIEAMTQ